MLLINPADGQIVDANESAESFYGYSLSQLSKMNISQINTLTLDEIKIEIANAVNQNKTFFNFRHRLAQGVIRDVEVHSGIINLKDQPLLYSIVHDVTDRKLTETCLKESEEKFRVIFETAKDSIEIVSMDGHIIDINQIGCEQLSYSKNEMLGMHLSGFTSPENTNKIEDRMELIKRRGNITFDSHRIRKNGSDFPVEVNCTYVQLKGQPVFVSISRDMTERKKAEMLLAESEKQHRTLFKNMLDGYVECKLLFENGTPQDFFIINANDQVEKLTGLKNIVGKKVREVIPGIRESNSELFEAGIRVALGGQTEKLETHLESLAIWLSLAVYSNAKEQIVVVFQNITERKRTEQEMIVLNNLLMHEVDKRTADLAELSAHVQEVAEKERVNLARELHDELGSNMAVAIMNVDRLKETVSDPNLLNELTSLKDLLKSATNSMRSVVSQLYPTGLDSLGIIPAIKWLVQTYEKHAGLDIELLLPKENILMEQTVELAAYRITQECLTNIAKHADASKVKVEVKTVNDFLDLRIHDDGVGLPDDIKTGGHGIFGMIERARFLGGSMEITNNSKGTTAHLSLPLAAEKPKNLKRVLIVDDHAIIRDALRQLLSREATDFSVEGEAVDGMVALQMAIEEEWDIILLDITLPKLNGIQVLEAIMAAKPKQPVIMLSSNPEQEYGEIARSKGAACYIEKGKTGKLVEAMRRATLLS